ncbi:MAG: Gfo/Idh/MocA family oxidoreductase [Verrucomicrobia bacterium]|jgi:predicted dehydrogenase|nr:Gfo/Idh/MocA family oxidoreductase [Verrucomicrobiota bacterium]
MKRLMTSWLFCCVWMVSIQAQGAPESLRLGMIGLDTSHVIAFTRILNDTSSPDHVPGGKVVAAFKGGSDDVESSYTRVEKFTEQLSTDFGVEIVASIEELCEKVDAILLESVDGRPHLEQARIVIEAGKPLFIDKPMAGSLKDVIEIFKLAHAARVPCFSSSSLRYYDSLLQLKSEPIGELKGAISYGPCSLEPHHPDLFWYGVHPTEALFAVMGMGCESVSRVFTEETDIVSGIWDNGNTGVVYGLRTGHARYKVTLFGTKGIAEQKGGGNYVSLVQEIMKFFQTGKPPITARETVELFAFMEGADISKANEGRKVNIPQLIRSNGGGWLLND